MSQWTDTPFGSLEEAHKTAVNFELDPSPAVTKGDYNTFTAIEGRNIYIMAQHVDGGPVREKKLPRRGKGRYKPKQEGPFFIEQDRMLVGPWCRVDEYHDLQDVEDDWRKQIVNFDNVEVFQLVLYRIGSDEYEYLVDAQSTMWCRVLHCRDFAGRDSFHWALARELFGRDPTPEQKQRITDAVNYVLHVWPDRKEE